jgi:hypothetical protein
MTNYITGFDYETYTDKAIPFVSFSLSLGTKSTEYSRVKGA